jgi:hypothetical protein
MSTYFRNWRNADRFKPNITPPRQKFQGFVEFHFNPGIASVIDNSSAFRSQISTLVQTAKIPEITFQTAVKRQYNHRRIVQTGVDYGPCSITVVDTVANEWLTLFMKYFAFQYNDPRNRTGAGAGNERDTDPKQWESNSVSTTKPSAFMTDSYNSNDAGMDIHNETHFIDSIRIINYHGGKGVEYILFRPQITSFTPSELDYTGSDFRTFDIDFEIESMTVNQKFNFDLVDTDLVRLEQITNVEGIVNNVLDKLLEAGKESVGIQGANNTRNNEFLGSPTDGKRNRAQQTIGGIQLTETGTSS